MSEFSIGTYPVPFPTIAHFTAGRNHDVPVDLIVLHSTGGHKAGDLQVLLGLTTRVVSVHFYIEKTGKIQQLVSIGRTAYHAGQASWQGHSNVNSRSIGIEQEHIDGKEEWPDVQIHTAGALCAALCKAYPHILPEKDITSHSIVARPHGRKVDPVAYPWSAFHEYVRFYLQGTNLQSFQAVK